ncbi:MAG: sodium:proton exchanger [Acidimicrobiia bacterium]
MTAPDVASPAAAVEHPGRKRAAFAAAIALTLPGAFLRLGGGHPTEAVGAAVFGIAVIGAAFLLAWGAEALELDVSRGLALAVLALIAVLPEYAVDFTFAFKAGTNPDVYAPLALANMTGGNRLLIGIGWPLVVLLAAWRMRSMARSRGYTGEIDSEVSLDRPHAIEIGFLVIATLYSLTLPLKDRLTLFDAAILVALYLAYAVRISRSPAEEPELIGPAQLFLALSKVRRRVTVGLLLGYAALVIVLCAEPFAESLVDTGKQFGISTFLLVQWLAPLASEAPELLVAALFAWRLRTNSGLGTLVSSKVNQWTLLVGTLPLVFVIAGGALSGLPLDVRQREELFLTAAQSAFAVAVLVSRSINVREALALLGLFLGQFVLGGVLPPDLRQWERVGMGILYLVLAAITIVHQRRAVRPLLRDAFRTPVIELAHAGDAGPDMTGSRT